MGRRSRAPVQTLDVAFSGFVNLDKLPPLVGETSQLWAQALFLYLYLCIYEIHVVQSDVCLSVSWVSHEELDNTGRMFHGISISGDDGRNRHGTARDTNQEQSSWRSWCGGATWWNLGVACFQGLCVGSLFLSRALLGHRTCLALMTGCYRGGAGLAFHTLASCHPLNFTVTCTTVTASIVRLFPELGRKHHLALQFPDCDSSSVI